MITVSVNGKQAYTYCMENGLRNRLGSLLLEKHRPCRAAVVSDCTVADLHMEGVLRSLHEAGFECFPYTFAQGEQSKNLTEWAKLLSFLAENRFARTDLVVALGGGVTGDLAGFAAATYLRGIGLVQVPTTLLAMVDSSLGGKTACNLPEGKNMVGAFYPPLMVACDPEFLQTLPEAEMESGAAECIKYGMIGNAALFDALSSSRELLCSEQVLLECVKQKAMLIAEDEFDFGARRLLNFGHTFGHAIEKCSGYTLPHGFAVAIGMLYASRLSLALGKCGCEVPAALEKALVHHHLPLSAPYGAEALSDAVLSDKKRTGFGITLVLPEKIGFCVPVDFPIGDIPRLMRLAAGE